MGGCDIRRHSDGEETDCTIEVITVSSLPFETHFPLFRAKTKGGGSVKGESQQMVVLWYLHGKPLMGRGWIEDNALKAIFVHKGKVRT